MPMFQTRLIHRYNKSKNPLNLTLKTPLELKTLQVFAVVHLNPRSLAVAVFVLFLNQTYFKKKKKKKSRYKYRVHFTELKHTKNKFK